MTERFKKEISPPLEWSEMSCVLVKRAARRLNKREFLSL